MHQPGSCYGFTVLFTSRIRKFNDQVRTKTSIRFTLLNLVAAVVCIFFWTIGASEALEERLLRSEIHGLRLSVLERGHYKDNEHDPEHDQAVGKS